MASATSRVTFGTRPAAGTSSLTGLGPVASSSPPLPPRRKWTRLVRVRSVAVAPSVLSGIRSCPLRRGRMPVLRRQRLDAARAERDGGRAAPRRSAVGDEKSQRSRPWTTRSLCCRWPGPPRAADARLRPPRDHLVVRGPGRGRRAGGRAVLPAAPAPGVPQVPRPRGRGGRPRAGDAGPLGPGRRLRDVHTRRTRRRR